MDKEHQISIGPYRSGKSWSLLKKAVQNSLLIGSGDQHDLSLHRETIIVVPSQRYRKSVEKRLFKIMNADQSLESAASTNQMSALWGLKIVSFYQFCQSLLLKAGIFKKILPDAGRGALLTAVCKDLIESGKISKLDKIIYSSSMQASLFTLFEEWQRAGYSSLEISERINKLKTDPQRKELANIFFAYQKALKKLGYTDEHDLVKEVTDLLSNQNETQALNDLLIFDEFDRFNLMQINLLKALTKQYKQLYISFDYAEPTCNLFEEYAWKKRIYDLIDKELSGMFDFVYENTNQGKEATRAALPITVLQSSDRLAEMSSIASRIKSAMVLENVPASEIVVVARNLSTYKHAVEAAFREAGLDYYLDEPIAIKPLPIIRLIMALLSLYDNDFNRRQVIDCLRSVYFSKTAVKLNEDDVELLNVISLNRRIVERRSQWHEALKGHYNLVKSLDYIFDLLTPPKNLESTSDYVSWVETVIAKILDLDILEEQLNPQAVWTQKRALLEFRRQLAHLIEEENIACALKQPLRIETCYERLEKLVDKANFTRPPQTANQILVTSAELVPNEKFAQVFMVGLLEGEFPAIKNNKGFLSGHELEQWRKLGIEMYNARMEAGFEYALFASIVNRAKKQLTLSYPSIELEGNKNDLVPSFFFNSLPLEIQNESAGSFAGNDKALTSPRNALAYSMFEKGDRHLLTNKNGILMDFDQSLQEKFSFAEIRSKQLNGSPVNGYLCDHVKASVITINMPEYLNVGHFSDYGKCPFSFWLSRILKLMPHEEPGVGLTSLDKGNFYHKALEFFYKSVIEKQIKINLHNEKILQEMFAEAVSQAFIWLEKESWFRASEFWQQEKNALAFRLNNFFRAEFKRFVEEISEYEPHMVEVAFGPDNQYPPLLLSKNGKTVKIRGKIDRIDREINSFVSNKNYRVIDYKSGSASITRADFESGRNMQLPVYALALEQSIIPGSGVSAYQYLSIATGKPLSGKRKNREEIREDVRMLEDKVFEFVSNIEAGDFSVRPSDKRICLTCVHKKICRVKEFPS